MDGRTDPLNDAALDQEIEALLAAEPSPDFVARVRSRVAEEPASRSRGWRWPIAAAATAVAMVVVVAVWPRSEPYLLPVQSAPHLTSSVPAPAVTRPAEAPVLAAVRGQTAHVAQAPRQSIELALPRVIIADNEKQAFAMFVMNVREGRTGVPLPAAPDRSQPMKVEETAVVPVPIAAPIEIKPLREPVTLE